MAIDMTTVKSIIHNGKAVAKIEDSFGRVLWQMIGPAPSAVTITLTGGIKLSLTAKYGTAGQYGWVTASQLTEKTASTANAADGTTFFILPSATVQAIKNHTYTISQTVYGLTLSDWQAYYRGTAYVCYIKDNDLWCVGDLTNSVANDTVLGTTNNLHNFRLYYPNLESTGNYWVAITDTTSSTAGVTKWRFSNANYLINHTNDYNTSNKNRVQTDGNTYSGTITYNL